MWKGAFVPLGLLGHRLSESALTLGSLREGGSRGEGTRDPWGTLRELEGALERTRDY